MLNYANAIELEDHPQMQPLTQFFTQENIPAASWPKMTYIAKETLPSMASFLLTGSLLTPRVAEFYQRTPQIRIPLQIDDNDKTKQYYRAVIMVIDNKKQRDQALQADKLKESTIVELGLISINFAAMPEALIADVRKGQTPFGALLLKHKVSTQNIDTRYFKISCDMPLTAYLLCKRGETLYGRSNTLVRDDNHVWVAHVVEILSGKSL